MVELCRARGIRSGMFLMWGYEGEQLQDIEATVEHVRRVQPDVFFTTLAYPIKGTPYYRQVEDRLVQAGPWALTSDRELRIAGRHSPAFYGHADRLLRDEVQLAALDRQPGADPALAQALRAGIQAARSALLATQGEVEA